MELGDAVFKPHFFNELEFVKPTKKRHPFFNRWRQMYHFPLTCFELIQNFKNDYFTSLSAIRLTSPLSFRGEYKVPKLKPRVIIL